MAFARCCSLFLLGLMAMSTSAQPTRRLPVPGGSTPLLIAPAAEQPVQLRQARIEGEVQAGIAQNGNAPSRHVHLAYRWACDDYRGSTAIQLIVEHCLPA